MLRRGILILALAVKNSAAAKDARKERTQSQGCVHGEPKSEGFRVGVEISLVGGPIVRRLSAGLLIPTTQCKKTGE